LPTQRRADWSHKRRSVIVVISIKFDEESTSVDSDENTDGSGGDGGVGGRCVSAAGGVYGPTCKRVGGRGVPVTDVVVVVVEREPVFVVTHVVTITVVSTIYEGCHSVAARVCSSLSGAFDIVIGGNVVLPRSVDVV
jgi:hypothetical protein